jgi:hypothetical protein
MATVPGQQKTSEVRYLVFDVESVADGQLIADTRFPELSLSPEAAVRRFRNELLMSGGKDFIPYTYQIPVVVVIAKLRADFSLIEIVSLDQPQHRPHVITKLFWSGWSHYEHPTWVTFNGRTFDLPLMEQAAFRFGIPIPQWFNLSDRSQEQFRYRYNLQSHFDLQELLTNFGTTWFRGGLNLAAGMLGKPGKMDVQGDMVYDYYRQGRVAEIDQYCRCDVLDTYFVLLRSCVLLGKLTLEEERERIETARCMIEAQCDQQPAYRQYLDLWRDWPDPWEAASKAALTIKQ